MARLASAPALTAQRPAGTAGLGVTLGAAYLGGRATVHGRGGTAAFETALRVAATARELGTTIVRVFSFFIPAGEPPERYRAQVIDRALDIADQAVQG